MERDPPEGSVSPAAGTYAALMTVAAFPATGVRSSLLAGFRPRTGPPSTAAVLRSALWPAAILTVLHHSFVVATNGGGDYKPVYRAVFNFTKGWDIYNEHLDYVDVHYLYPPGGTLLLAPFGYLPFEASKNWFIVMNAVAMLLAWYLLLRMFGFALASVAAPALLLAMFSTETVVSTFWWTNINGLDLLLVVAFFRWLLDGRTSRQWWAGLAIGVTLVCKPLLLPLLLIPLMRGQWPVRDEPQAAGAARPRLLRGIACYVATAQWRAALAAIVVPIVFNAVAWPLLSDPMDYVTRILPYVMDVRDYANYSVAGVGLYYGLPASLILLLRVVFAMLGVGSLWLLYRYYRTREPLLWMLTSSGVLLTTSWLVSTLGQHYYSMMLFPFLMTVVLPNSVLRNWPAWLAIYGFLTPDMWWVWHWPA
ncbi:MAG: glycosyltransferase family 87 protein, partial [Mycobacterium sp.]